MDIETFPALDGAGLFHGFSTRSQAPLPQLDEELVSSFQKLGCPIGRGIHAAQPHGNRVAVVGGPYTGRVPDVDALATSTPQLPLIVRVADCGPVFFHDPVRRVIALTHSGRRGTEGNIVGETVACLEKDFGCAPENLVVQLGPCIRPPHYEIDFAAEIGRQARAAGVTMFHDVGTCTACQLDRYYSYRAEKGQTGRMWAVLMLR